MTFRVVAAGVALLCARIAHAQTPITTGHAPHGSVTAARATTAPRIDGTLTDEVWQLATPASGFIQRDPDEGSPATEATEVRVLYDDEAVYVGLRMNDQQATLISQRLSGRDGEVDSDWVQVYLDPMHDHRTGAQFRVSASNAQKDSVLFNDSWDDKSWDAVWQSATTVDGEGWTAELRIPLSQLRFLPSASQTWGINVQRFIKRKNEDSWLEPISKSENRLASRMAHLNNLEGITPRRHIELLPYTAARTEFVAPASGNPFNDGSRAFASAGLDAKYGLTSNLTIDATVNPDFGQVEVDPAVVNLTQFETFFEEKRPFFLEGAQTFDNFGRDGATDFWGFNTSDPTIFYSRRIGRAPQLSPGGDFSDGPVAATILGAAKLTGKTSGGWTLAALEAVTGRETARLQTGALFSRTAVEPLSNYLAARLQHPLGGRAGVGMIVTNVSRQLDTAPLRDTLTGQAVVLGGDGYIYLDRRHDWVITGKLSASRVTGSTNAIARLQKAAQRYFQRPDAPQVLLDPSRTSLSGISGRVNLNRNSGTWRVNSALWGVSPGFEANDLGFMGSGDKAGAHTVVMWRKVQPDRWTRSKNIWAAKWYTWNFGRQLTGDGAQANANTTFRNYWTVGGNVSARRRTLDDRLTRGGPLAQSPGGGSVGLNFSTDGRRTLSVTANGGRNWNESGSTNGNFQITATIKPSSRLTLTTGPQVNAWHTVAQYVTQTADPTAAQTSGGRYVFATLDQTQITFTTRASLLLSSRVALQLYTQPLLSAGDYTDFKEFSTPRAYDFRSYGRGPSTLALGGNVYTADPDGAGVAPAFTFDNPDFNIRSLQVNAVFRWELKPGSTFYGVWTRLQREKAFAGDFNLGRDSSALFSAPGDDVFLVKMAYWIGR